MVPTTVIRTSLPTLLAGDVANLAAAAVKHVHLMAVAFTPAANTAFVLLNEATFTGYTALNAAAGAQQAFTDLTTGLQVVQLIEPLAGWHWVCTAAPGTPQTIYGVMVTDAADAVTFGSFLLPTPLVVQSVGDAIDLPQIRFTFNPTPLT